MTFSSAQVMRSVQSSITYSIVCGSAIVSIMLPCTIFELFDVQNIVTLKSKLGAIEGH